MKVSRPTIYILVVAIGAAAWFLTTEDSEASRKSTERAASTNSSPLPEGFTEADLSARFEPSTDAVKDAFRPVVERRRGGSETAIAPNAVPSILTGGDPNWVYTGMAEIDGVPTGLLENKSTGEAEFVKQAQSWKDARIQAISPFSIVLVGRNGKSYTLVIGDDVGDRPIMATNGFSPINPALRGNIGNSLEIAPERPNRRNNNQSVSATTQNGTGSIEVQND